VTLELLIASWLLNLACVMGLLWRRRSRDCWSFIVYILALLTCEGIVALWPRTFFTYTWYLRFQAVYNVLKFAVALEIALRAFRAFPAALARIRLIVFVILGSTTFLALHGPFGGIDLRRLLFDWEPRTQAAAIWLMTAEALLIVWYRLPVTPFQKAILLGFLPYLTVFGTLMDVLRHLDVATGWPLAVVSTLNSAAFVATCVWWTWAAWRPRPALAAPAVVDLPRAA
jgi:hypothetical protein